MRYATTTILTAVLALGLARWATAEELLVNGTLDSGLAPWSGCCGSTGTIGFDATRDASGSDLSGSGVLTHTLSSAEPTVMFVAQCVSGAGSLAGKAFFFGAKVRFREGETTPGRAFVSVEFRPDTACQQPSLSGGFDEVQANAFPRGTWIPLHIGSPTSGVVAPAGTNSMRVFVVLEKTASTKLTVNLDDVFAAPVGTPVCDGMPATLVGTAASEVLAGTSASDVIVGRGGTDWIDGKDGNDRICGGPGADVLYGGYGDDRLFGGGGADDLYGAGDDDLLDGGGGNDDLYGDAGLDRMKGGSGIDTCNGGSGLGDTAKKCETTTAVP